MPEKIQILVTITPGEDTKFIQTHEQIARQIAFTTRAIVSSASLGPVPAVEASIHNKQKELALK